MQRTSVTRMLALLLAAMLLLSAGCAKNNTSESNQTNNNENSADSAPSKSESTAELNKPENNDVDVETPYCTMTIPFAFSDLVSVDHQQKEANDSYVFSAVLDDRKVPVYTISFAPDGIETQGDRFGTLKGKDGTVQVTFQANDPDETLDEEALEAFYTAQETINDVFASIQATPGFTAA